MKFPCVITTATSLRFLWLFSLADLGATWRAGMCLEAEVDENLEPRVRQRQGPVHKHETQVPKQIAGVPVHNYHLTRSYQMNRSGALLEVNKPEEEIEERWLITFKNGITRDMLKNMCGDDCDIIGHPGGGERGGIPFVSRTGSQKDLSQMLDGKKSSAVVIEPDLPMYPIPEMGNYSDVVVPMGISPWGLEKIGRNSQSNEGEGTHIYILDTGIRASHSDFGGRAIPTLDMSTMNSSGAATVCKGSSNCAEDRNGHGTHCAGSAAGSKYGVAPKARVYGVKVFSDIGAGPTSWIVGAMDWVTRNANKPAVISMSLGGDRIERLYEVAIAAANAAGITVVVASGNDGQDACGHSPAYVPNAITVGASDERNSRAAFSNYGRCVDIHGPGVAVTSAGHHSDFQSTIKDGTSMACPHVAGAAALLLGQDRALSADQVKQKLLADAKKQMLSNLKAGDSNLLLWVAGGPPAQPPQVRPAPPPQHEGGPDRFSNGRDTSGDAMICMKIPHKQCEWKYYSKTFAELCPSMNCPPPSQPVGRPPSQPVGGPVVADNALCIQFPTAPCSHVYGGRPWTELCPSRCVADCHCPGRQGDLQPTGPQLGVPGHGQNMVDDPICARFPTLECDYVTNTGRKWANLCPSKCAVVELY